MRKLIMTRGLPASGKTTWAQKERERLGSENCYIVCKDDIRAELEATGWKWSREGEKDVLAIRDRQIRVGLLKDILVISADTNFGYHKAVLQQIAKECDAEFVVKDFTNVPVTECIKRDMKRERSVGEKVIMNMYNKYVALPSVEKYTPDPMKPRSIICDIDGTLALFDGQRSPYDIARCKDDRLNEPIAEIVRTFAKTHQIVYASGRENKFRAETMYWLKQNMMPFGPLFMRTTGDHRKDYLVKLELFNDHIRNNYCVDFVLDDRDQVVRMWRELGLTCLQVAEGSF